MRRTLLICMFIVLLLGGSGSLAQHASQPPTELAQAEWLLSPTQPGSADEARWQAVELPFMGGQLPADVWQQAVADGSLWFRFWVQRPPGLDEPALLFWRYNLALTVYFNGTEVAGNGKRPNRLTTAWNRPLLARLNDRLWRAGDNEVLVQLHVTEWGGNLAPVLFGEREHLLPVQEQRQFQQVELNRILLAFALTIGLFTLGLWIIRRQDTVYLWFAGICLTWAAGSSHTVVLYNPFPFDLWLALVHSAIDLCIFFLYGFIGRLAQARVAFREHMLLAWTILAMLVHHSVPPHMFWYSAYAVHVVGITFLSVMIVRVFLVAWRQRRTEAIVISAAILAQITLFLFNAFQMFYDNGSGWDGTLVYAHLGIPMLLLVFASILLKRFTDALSMAEELNRELEQKVEVSRQIIARNFEERRMLEMKQATERERLKIYRDLHDDVGSRLLSIIHADPDAKLGALARSALESLRQAVSRANTPDQPLPVLLSDIREEMELRLKGSGHQLNWQQSTNIPGIIIPSLVAFNINRILKELVSNIIRHARANNVTTLVRLENDDLIITLEDDGCGFDVAIAPGNGLRHIRARAEETGGHVDWRSTTNGTRTRLIVPGITNFEALADRLQGGT